MAAQTVSPRLIFTREIVIQPRGEAEERAGPLFQPALSFSWKQDATKRLRAQLWPHWKESWSKSPAPAVPTPNCTGMCCAGHIWCKWKHSLALCDDSIVHSWPNSNHKCESATEGVKKCYFSTVLSSHGANAATFWSLRGESGPASLQCVFMVFCNLGRSKSISPRETQLRKKIPILSWKHASADHKRYSHIPNLDRNSLDFMPRITANSELTCVSHTAAQQTCSRAAVGARLRVKSVSGPLYSSPHPTHSPWVPSALLDNDIRSLELPNGGQWPRLMVPELSQRHRRLPHSLPTIQLGWVIGCGWGVVVKPNVEGLGMCAHTTDGTGGGKSRRGKRDSQDNQGIFLLVIFTETCVMRDNSCSWKKREKKNLEINSKTSNKLLVV